MRLLFSTRVSWAAYDLSTNILTSSRASLSRSHQRSIASGWPRLADGAPSADGHIPSRPAAKSAPNKTNVAQDNRLKSRRDLDSPADQRTLHVKVQPAPQSLQATRAILTQIETHLGDVEVFIHRKSINGEGLTSLINQWSRKRVDNALLVTFRRRSAAQDAIKLGEWAITIPTLPFTDVREHISRAWNPLPSRSPSDSQSKTPTSAELSGPSASNPSNFLSSLPRVRSRFRSPAQESSCELAFKLRFWPNNTRLGQHYMTHPYYGPYPLYTPEYGVSDASNFSSTSQALSKSSTKDSSAPSTATASADESNEFKIVNRRRSPDGRPAKPAWHVRPPLPGLGLLRNLPAGLQGMQDLCINHAAPDAPQVSQQNARAWRLARREEPHTPLALQKQGRLLNSWHDRRVRPVSSLRQ